MILDWRKLYFGKLNKRETLKVVKDETWQQVRISMKGKTVEEKYRILYEYVYSDLMDKVPRNKQIQSTNYVTALSRGGIIKPEDYRTQ